jgi:hypothetical protein
LKSLVDQLISYDSCLCAIGLRHSQLQDACSEVTGALALLKLHKFNPPYQICRRPGRENIHGTLSKKLRVTHRTRERRLLRVPPKKNSRKSFGAIRIRTRDLNHAVLNGRHDPEGKLDMCRCVDLCKGSSPHNEMRDHIQLVMDYVGVSSLLELLRRICDMFYFHAGSPCIYVACCNMHETRCGAMYGLFGRQNNTS